MPGAAGWGEGVEGRHRESRAEISLGGLLLPRRVLALVLIAPLVRQLSLGGHRSSLPARLPCGERMSGVW